MRLTKTERLLLANQYEILARLNPDFESSYYTKREIVLRGFELEMSSLFHTLDEEGLSVDGLEGVISRSARVSRRRLSTKVRSPSAVIITVNFVSASVDFVAYGNVR
jgi:YfbU protein